MKKSILYLALLTVLFVSCSKNDADDGPDGAGTPGTINGFWKGSTNTYGVGTLLRSNGTARSFIYPGGLTMPDTSNSAVMRAEGTYTITGSDIAVVCANTSPNFQLKFTGKVNTGFTSMDGTSVFKSDITVTQTFNMKK